MKEKKEWVVTCIVAGVFILIILLFSIIFALLNINNENIIKGVYINEVELSDLSKSEAREKIEALIDEKLSEEIAISYEDYQSTINSKLLEIDYDINSAIEQAYSVGRDGNLISNNYGILKSMIFKEKIELNIGMNEEVAKTTIQDISSNLPGAVVESSYYIEENELIITKGKTGVVVDEEKFLNEINNNYANLTIKTEGIEIPVQTKEPEAVDIDKIHEEVYKEAKDAYYNEEPFEIYPETQGIDFDVEAAKELLQEEKEEYVIKLIITQPKVTINDLGDVAFRDELAKFTTKYDVSNTDRTTNLKLATKKINGTILAAGEEFSYNKVVGERTIAAGYKEAKVYSNGEVVDGIGGGICQISTTLYNAVLLANLEVTQRRNHQFVTSYVPAGRDATVVYGSQDFKFKNTRKYPVKIEASVSNGIAKIAIYGIKEEKEYDISFQTKTISTIPYSTIYKEDNTLLEGTEKVKQKGANGLITETYKITKYNGALVSKELLSKDTYSAMKKIILKGTKENKETTKAKETKTTDTTKKTETNKVEKTTPSTQEETDKIETTND